jgi:hypothetical protein
MEQSLGMNDIYAIFKLFGCCVCFCSFDFVSGHRAQRWMGRSGLNTQTKSYSIEKKSRHLTHSTIPFSFLKPKRTAERDAYHSFFFQSKRICINHTILLTNRIGPSRGGL